MIELRFYIVPEKKPYASIRLEDEQNINTVRKILADIEAEFEKERKNEKF